MVVKIENGSVHTMTVKESTKSMVATCLLREPCLSLAALVTQSVAEEADNWC